METQNDIVKELLEIAPKLALMEKTNAYKVPAGYFLNFKDAMLQKVVALNMSNTNAASELQGIAPQLAKVEKHALADMPENYFTDFSAKVMSKIKAQEVATELSAIAPALSIIEKTNAIEVPANYFNSFPERMMKLVSVEETVITPKVSWPTRVNEMLDQLIGIVFKPKYTIAYAGFASVLVLAIMLTAKVEQGDDLDKQLAQLSTEDISNYLDNKSDAYDDEVFEMKVDDKAVSTGSIHPYTEALKDIDDDALNAAIAD